MGRVALEYELTRGRSQDERKECMFYNRFNIKIDIKYSRKLDKMAKENSEMFEALEIIFLKKIRVASVTLKLKYEQEKRPKYFKDLNL
jgi:hypothetical protein